MVDHAQVRTIEPSAHRFALLRIVAITLTVASTFTTVVANANDGSWSNVATFTAPPTRFGQSSILDPARHRLVMFGGSPGLGQAMLSDLWAFSTVGDNAWAPLLANGAAPTPRYTQSAVYDPVRDRMLLFGGDPGFGVPFLSDVWELTLGGVTPVWTQLTPSGPQPAGRSAQSMIYDSIRDRLLVFGGQMRDGTVLGDVWQLSLAGSPTWTQLSPSGSPGALAFHSALYDPVRDRMLVYGGFDNIGTESGKLWSLDLAASAWSLVTTAGVTPTARYGHAADYDAIHDAMLVFGGTHAGAYQNQVLTLGLSRPTPTWLLRLPAGMVLPGTSNPTANFDSNNARLLVFGGLVNVNGSLVTNNLTLSLATNPAFRWTNAPSQPTPRQGMATAYDPVHRRMLAFGGYDGKWTSSETYAYDFASRTWSQTQPATATVPTRRWGGAGAFDTARNRFIVIDGFAGNTNQFGQGLYLNDVWAFDVGTNAWSQIVASGTSPSARRGHTLIYDAVADRLVLFGGYDSHGTFSNEVWSLSLAGTAQWTLLTPPGGGPAPRNSATAIFEPTQQRMVVFGGSDCCVNYGDVWALGLSGTGAWTEIAPAGSGPSARTLAAGTYDSVRHALLIFGGAALPNTFNDSWELPLSGPPVWRQLSVTGVLPTPRSAMAAAYDPPSDRLVVAGGAASLFYAPFFADTDELQLTASAGDVPTGSISHVRNPQSAVATLALTYPGTPRAHASLSCAVALPEAGPCEISIWDVHGRLCAREAWSQLPAGRSAIAVPGATRVGPGMYVVQLRSSSRTLRQKLMLIP